MAENQLKIARAAMEEAISALEAAAKDLESSKSLQNCILLSEGESALACPALTEAVLSIQNSLLDVSNKVEAYISDVVDEFSTTDTKVAGSFQDSASAGVA